MTEAEAKDYIREWCPYGRQEEIIKALEQEPFWKYAKRGKYAKSEVQECLLRQKARKNNERLFYRF